MIAPRRCRAFYRFFAAAFLVPVRVRAAVPVRVREAVFFFRTVAPSRRASERPIAIACLRLLTRVPVLPLFNVPRLRSCIARSTFLLAVFPYFAISYAPNWRR